MSLSSALGTGGLSSLLGTSGLSSLSTNSGALSTIQNILGTNVGGSLTPMVNPTSLESGFGTAEGSMPFGGSLMTSQGLGGKLGITNPGQ